MSPQPVGNDFPAGRVVVYEPAPTVVTAASAGRAIPPATRVPAARLRATREAVNRDRRWGGFPARASPGGPRGVGVGGASGADEDPAEGSLEGGVGSVAMGVSSGMKTGYAVDGGGGTETVGALSVLNQRNEKT